MRNLFLALVVSLLFIPALALAGPEPDTRFPLFAYLTGGSASAMVTYTPSELDPRQEANQRRLSRGFPLPEIQRTISS
jgi:hypothetical protein